MATNSVFDHSTLSAIWFKAQTVQGYDANVYRKDVYGNWMKWDQYGQTSDYGWEVDHIIPISRGGSSLLNNLQPLYWQNNRKKCDNYI